MPFLVLLNLIQIFLLLSVLIELRGLRRDSRPVPPPYPKAERDPADWWKGEDDDGAL